MNGTCSNCLEMFESEPLLSSNHRARTGRGMSARVMPAGWGAPGPPDPHRRPPQELSALDWSHQRLSALPDLRNLAHFTRHVRALNLSGNALLKLQGLENLPALETLNVSNNRLVRLDLAQNVNLLHLDASDNSLMAVAGLEGCHHLTHLSLRRNCLSRLEGLDAQRRLETLDVSHNACEILGDLSKCARLTTVNLSHNAIATLAGASERLPPSLRTLDLGVNELVDVTEVRHLAAAPNLASLVLSGNPLYALAISLGFEPRAVVAFALPRLAALDGEGTSTAAWAASAKTTLFRNDVGQLCPDLLRLLADGPSRGLHGYLASAVPATFPRQREALSGASTARVADDRTHLAGGGPPGGSMFTTSSFVPKDMWSPLPSPAASPAERSHSDASTAPAAPYETPPPRSRARGRTPRDGGATRKRVERGGDATASSTSTQSSSPGNAAALATRSDVFDGELAFRAKSAAERRESASAALAQSARAQSSALESETEALRFRLSREAKSRRAAERRIRDMRDEATRARPPSPDSGGVSENEAFEGTAGAHAGRYAFDTRLEQTFESESEASGVGFTYRTPAALPDVADGASDSAEAAPMPPSAIGSQLAAGRAARSEAAGSVPTPTSMQGKRLAAARAARAEARAAAAVAKTPIPISPAEFTRSDISLSPSPIPVTLAASIATAATAGLVSEVENRAVEGVAGMTPSPASRQRLTLQAENTPIPLSPAEFSASDIDFDVGRSEGSIASLGVGRSVDSIGSLGASARESEYTDRTEDSFGGLPGADDFMREAAAHHAWQTVTSAFSPPPKENSDDDDTRTSSDVPLESEDADTVGDMPAPQEPSFSWAAGGDEFMRTAHLARVDGGRVRIATVDDVALAKSSSSSSAGTSRGTGTTGGTMMMTARVAQRSSVARVDTSVSAGASRATLVTESTGVIGPAATASKGTSSLVTLSDADAWLLEAARFARPRRFAGDGPASGSATASESETARDSGGASTEDGSASVGIEAGSSAARTSSPDTLPGGERWLSSPGARGALDAYENARSTAATEEEEENDNNDESFGWGPEGFVRSAAARRAWDATISSVAKRADRTSEHSSPAPPSDRQLADQLREKIAALRTAERRGDAMIAAVRAAERHGDESDSEGRDTPSSSVPAVTDDTGSGSGSIDTIPGADDWLRSNARGARLSRFAPASSDSDRADVSSADGSLPDADAYSRSVVHAPESFGDGLRRGSFRPSLRSSLAPSTDGDSVDTLPGADDFVRGFQARVARQDAVGRTAGDARPDDDDSNPSIVDADPESTKRAARDEAEDTPRRDETPPDATTKPQAPAAPRDAESDEDGRSMPRAASPGVTEGVFEDPPGDSREGDEKNAAKAYEAFVASLDATTFEDGEETLAPVSASSSRSGFAGPSSHVQVDTTPRAFGDASFYDPLDATREPTPSPAPVARSEAASTADEGESARLSAERPLGSPREEPPFDADALMSSTIESMFGEYGDDSGLNAIGSILSRAVEGDDAEDEERVAWVPEASNPRG